MDNAQNSQSSLEKGRAIVDKIASGKQASYSDEPLTPPRKIQAEQMRMLQGPGAHEERQEEDKQIANLGGAILTPQKKMDRARQEASESNKRNLNL